MRHAAMAFTLIAGALLSCSEAASDARSAAIVDTLTSYDQAFLRDRPQLMVGKFATMGAFLFDYYRGEVPLFWRDFQDPESPIGQSQFSLSEPLVASIGDSHTENFGILWASDGTAALEQNDFDASDRVPYLFDLRRLVVGMVLAAYDSNPDDTNANAAAIADASNIARAAASGYATEITRIANGGAPVRYTSDVVASDPYLNDLFGKAATDQTSHLELSTNPDGSGVDGEMTEIVNGARQLRRGRFDSTSPNKMLLDLPPIALAELPEVLAQWRTSIANPPDPSWCQVLDGARLLGSGVSSFQKVRAIALLRGPTDDPSDDFMLELKEITDPPNLVSIGPTVWANDTQSRIEEMLSLVWSRPDADPHWGTSSWLGFPLQLRGETEGNKDFKVEKLTGDRGTPAAIETLATDLGALLARVHSAVLPDARTGSTHPGSIVARRINENLQGFLDEQASVGPAYAAIVVADYARLQSLLVTRGPLLGFVPSPADAPPPELAALYGTPLP